MILASLESVPADLLKNMALMIFAGVGLAAAVKSIWWPGRREISPQPLQVTPATRFVTEETAVQKDAALRERMARLEAIVEQIRLEAKTDREGIVAQLHALELRLIADAERRDRNTQARINDLLASVSKVIGALDQPTKTGGE